MAVSGDTKPSFNQFDVVSDHSDHHFADMNHNLIGTTANKKIMAEWRILKKDLPETIYVSTYETRMDLVRAVIVGAQGTPYEDGLFFFDIKFPDNYPNEPPKVHYRSHGLHLNPNLYQNGKVCLSLLNTWYGRSGEKWDPSQSTLLQVLVSIQALVLNEQPLFNEPALGFWKWLFGLKGMSKDYNDNAFISTCRSTLYLLQKPPKNFEDFTAEHFGGRASRILRACNDYSKHGGYYNNESTEAGASVHKASKQFKKSMEQLHPQLVSAFNKNEAALLKKKNEASLLKKKNEESLLKKKNEASLKIKNEACLKKNPAEWSLTTFTDEVVKKIELAATPGRLFILSGALLVSAFVAVSKKSR